MNKHFSSQLSYSEEKSWRSLCTINRMASRGGNTLLNLVTWLIILKYGECGLSHIFPLKVHGSQITTITRLEMGSAPRLSQQGGELVGHKRPWGSGHQRILNRGLTELSLVLRRLSPGANCSTWRMKAGCQWETSNASKSGKWWWWAELGNDCGCGIKGKLSTEPVVTTVRGPRDQSRVKGSASVLTLEK